MEPMKPMAPMKPLDPGPAWWPDDLGQPSASGGQNDDRFAFFPDKHRLAIHQGGKVTVYDTGDHDISGMSDSNGQMAFVSQKGTVTLDELRTA